MSTFEAAIQTILQHEVYPRALTPQCQLPDYWVNDPVDAGGETAWGISMLMIRAEKISAHDLGLANLDHNSLKELTRDKAEWCYRKFFWDRYHYENISDQTVATKAFDCAVNCGPGRAARMIQKAVNDLVPNALVVDGSLGPKSFAAINSQDPQKLLATFVNQMSQYYNSIVLNHPSQAKFLKNWLKRAQWRG